MLRFRPITLEDKNWINPLVFASKSRNADFSFVNMFAWSRDYAQRVCCCDGCLIGEVTIDGERRLSFPLGVTDDTALRTIVTELRAAYSPFVMSALSSAHVAELSRVFPGEFTAESDPNLSDYLYDLDKLTTLAGKKLHAKRNYINRFTTDNPDWTFEPVTPLNAGECMMTDGLWLYNKKDDGFDTIPGEVRALERALTNFTAIGLDGGLLRLRKGGSVAAFTIGERLSEDTYVTHFEKALPDIDGAYQMINREFARAVKEKYPSVRYVNREEDMGIEKLRQAKRSYYPDLMEDKYTARFSPLSPGE
jgi:hypothetical protein